MSDTMRNAFEARFKSLDLSTKQDSWGRPQYKHSHVDALWTGWKAAQNQPSPPVPQTVQEIMRLMMPYVSACGEFDDASTDKLEEAEAGVAAAFAPLQAALTALVEKNHELQFSLDGVNAMRRSAMEEHAARWVWARKNLLSACFQSGKHNSGQTSITPIGEANTDWYWDKIADQFRGIEPEQGEVK